MSNFWEENSVVVVEPEPANFWEAESGPIGLETAPDPTGETRQIQDTIAVSNKYEMPVEKTAQRAKYLGDLYTQEAYNAAVAERQAEKKEMGLAGYWEEIIDGLARSGSRIGSAVIATEAALVRGTTTIAGRRIPLNALSAFMNSPLAAPKVKDIQKLREKTADILKVDAEELYRISQHPDLAAQDEGKINWGINIVAETIPYITMTTAATMIAGPLGGFTVGAMVEGNSAYRTGIESGLSDTQAKAIAAGVGIISGAIETVGGKFAEDLLNRASAKIRNKILRKGAKFGIGTMVEALEEATQEITAIAGESIYKDVDWKEAVTRVGTATAGGAFLGGTFRGLQVASQQLTQQESKFAALTPTEQPGEFQTLENDLTEAIANDTGLPEDQARKIAKESIEEKFYAPEEKAERAVPAIAEAIEKPAKAPVKVPEKPAKPRKPARAVVEPKKVQRAPEQVETAKSPVIQEQVAEVVETDFTEKPPEKFTVAKQASIKKDREALGLDEINSKTRRGWEESLKTAKEQNVPAKAQRLADEINAEPRPLNDIETAGVTIRMAELKNEHEAAMKSVAEATDDASVKTKAVETARIEAEFEALSRAVDLSGTEKGRALVAQKLTINRDYKLVSVVTRAKVAKGKSLSAKERANFETLTKELTEANSRIDALEMEVSEIKAVRNLRTARTAKGFAQMSQAQRNANLSSLAADVNALLEQGCAN